MITIPTAAIAKELLLLSISDILFLKKPTERA